MLERPVSWHGFVMNDQANRDFGVSYPPIVLPPQHVQAEAIWVPRAMADNTWDEQIGEGTGTIDTPGGGIWVDATGAAMTTDPAYSVDGASLVHTQAAAVTDLLLQANSESDSEALVQFSATPVSGTPVGHSFAGVVKSDLPSANRFEGMATYQASGAVTLHLRQVVASVASNLTTPVTVLTGVPSSAIMWLRVRVRGSAVMARLWREGTSEPTTWQAVGSTGFQFAGNDRAGMRMANPTGQPSVTWRVYTYTATSIISEIATDATAEGGLAVSDQQNANTVLSPTLVIGAPPQPGIYQVTARVRFSEGTGLPAGSIFGAGWATHPFATPEGGVQPGEGAIELWKNGVIARSATITNPTYADVDLGQVDLTQPGDGIDIRVGGSGSDVVYLDAYTLTQVGSPAGPVLHNYWIRITSIDGLWDGEVRDERYANPTRDGEHSGLLLYAGLPITIAGEVRGRDLPGLREGQRDLEAAFADLDAHELHFQLWNEEPLAIVARKNQKLAMGEEQRDSRFARTFTVQLRADDPRAYSLTEQVYTIGAGSVGTTVRTRTYPRRYPLVVGRIHYREYSGGGGGGGAGAVNNGPRPTAPVSTLYGPLTNPALQNLTTGEQIAWADLQIADGEFVTIDHKTGAITRNGTTPEYGGLDFAATQLWQLIPGENTIALTAFASGAASHAILRYRSAY